MNILILAAGDKPASTDQYPIWLSEVDGELVLERQLKDFLTLPDARIVLCVQAEDNRNFHLADIVSQISKTAVVVEVSKPTAGAACTAMLAVDKLDLDQELVVMSATDQIHVNLPEVIETFKAQGADAGILTFESLHPRYAYVLTDGDDSVVEVAEKRPISRCASTGFHWFRRAGDFLTAIQRMVLKDASVAGRFFIAPALNEFILDQKKVMRIGIAKDAYHPLKSTRDVQIMEREQQA